MGWGVFGLAVEDSSGCANNGSLLLLMLPLRLLLMLLLPV